MVTRASRLPKVTAYFKLKVAYILLLGTIILSRALKITKTGGTILLSKENTGKT